jgi:hypothetical protein
MADNDTKIKSSEAPATAVKESTAPPKPAVKESTAPPRPSVKESTAPPLEPSVEEPAAPLQVIVKEPSAPLQVIVKEPSAPLKTGLDSRWTAAVPWIGLAIFVINMALAWCMAFSTSEYIQRPLLSKGGDSAQVLTDMKGADIGQSVVYRGIIEGNVQMKAISNKQTTTIVGMAAGFGFLAIGFSLVIMAMRGAFELAATLPNKTGELVLRSSSPGVLCFVFGALIIVVALLQKHTIDFRGVTLEKTRTTEPSQPSQEPTAANPIAIPEPFIPAAASAAEAQQ